ncbi:hypothetical protein BP5796_06859 [Coleophoma crateriformis]|uniref:RNase III domain-containing protein n=1 Tax=Coleophoma crateriformis TaxID=565419 RepID=A0A3D8RQ11_9HELO|nr:hypothetical protein BP5796_06859 [Coleophoma crateriformis]
MSFLKQSTLPTIRTLYHISTSRISVSGPYHLRLSRNSTLPLRTLSLADSQPFSQLSRRCYAHPVGNEESESAKSAAPRSDVLPAEASVVTGISKKDLAINNIEKITGHVFNDKQILLDALDASHKNIVGTIERHIRWESHMKPVPSVVRVLRKREGDQYLSVLVPTRKLLFSRFFDINERIDFCSVCAQQISNQWRTISLTGKDIGVDGPSEMLISKLGRVLPAVAILQAVFKDAGLDGLRTVSANLGLGSVEIEAAKAEKKSSKEDPTQPIDGKPLSKQSAITEVQTLLGYKFKRPELLWEALVVRKNLRLALVGDSVLKTELRTNWYFTGNTDRRPGALATLDYSSTNEFLALQGRKRGINRFLLHPNNAIGKGINDQNIADGVEAIVGAIYLDPKHKNMQEIMSNLGIFRYMDQVYPADVEERIILQNNGLGIPFPPPETEIPGRKPLLLNGFHKKKSLKVQLKEAIQTKALEQPPSAIQHR